MRRLVDTPEAWETLDLRADVIGRRTMKSGRLSIMSRQPLFFLARSVVQQVHVAVDTDTLVGRIFPWFYLPFG